MSETIAILHPGEMGAAVGARLRERGLRVLWCPAGRSAATRKRAEQAGFEDGGALGKVLGASTIALSICPPHAALALARQVAAAGFRGVYVDANAISPETSRAAGRIVEAGGASFVDGGIIGPPPVGDARTRFYLSGTQAARLAPLLSSGALAALALDGPAGAASALKACYAAWNKGAHALIAGALALASHEGVARELIEEWRGSQPDALKRMHGIPGATRKAWRWVGEMEEIAAAFAGAGLPEGFHLAAAEIYRRMESFKDARSAPSLEDWVATLEGDAGARSP